MARYRCALAAAGALAAASPQLVFAQATETYTYDALGRLTGTAYPSGSTTTYGYDQADNRSHLTSTIPDRPPVANNDTATANAGGASVTIPVLNNDSDPDGDPLTITQVGTPSKGSVQISGGNLVYSATWHQQGADSFSYTISDGRGKTASATVTVTVNAPVWANSDVLYIHPTIFPYGSKPWWWWACVNALANDTGQNLAINGVNPSTYATYDSNGNVCYNYSNPSNVVPSPVTVWYGVVGTGGSDVSAVTIYLLPN